MEQLISACGLNCAECDAYKATQANDKEELGKIAVKWSEEYRATLTPETIKCDGCSAKTGRNGCYAGMCSVRACVGGHKLRNCAECREYGCDKISEIFHVAPQAQKNLDALRAKKGK